MVLPLAVHLFAMCYESRIRFIVFLANTFLPKGVIAL